MPLYLVTLLYDEGIYPSNFLVIDAPSVLAVAEHILSHPYQWQWFLQRAYPRSWTEPLPDFGSLWDWIQTQTLTPEQLLELIKKTGVDGDSEAQLAIHEITIQQLSTVNTNPWK